MIYTHSSIQTGADRKIQMLMNFLVDKVVPHLGGNEKDGNDISGLDSRRQVQGSEEEAASFYLKLLCTPVPATYVATQPLSQINLITLTCINQPTLIYVGPYLATPKLFLHLLDES